MRIILLAWFYVAIKYFLRFVWSWKFVCSKVQNYILNISIHLMVLWYMERILSLYEIRLGKLFSCTSGRKRVKLNTMVYAGCIRLRLAYLSRRHDQIKIVNTPIDHFGMRHKLIIFTYWIYIKYDIPGVSPSLSGFVKSAPFLAKYCRHFTLPCSQAT